MIVGREKEINILETVFRDDQSHFVAVYGRRRIGKTFLIRETFSNRFTFQHAGLFGGNLTDQLDAFDSSLRDAGYEPGKKSKTWMEAFNKLKELINASTEKRKVLFIDELSWMDTRKSKLITALEHFWNGWASARKDVVLIVCSSATSWLLSKVVHNKGGLYNRLTERIYLRPFSLHECEDFVQKKGLSYSRGQILQLYMVLGGVPYYWNFLKKGLGYAQNIDQMIFAENAPLSDEFDYLYASIFNNPGTYIKIIKALSKKKSGMTREEIIKNARVENSGDLSTKLEELESCGFIRKYHAYGMKKKNALYQLMDCFTLFYYQFMEKKTLDSNFWSSQVNTPTINAWKGLAFERVCLQHIEQMKQRLGISGVSTEVNSWYCKANNDKGVFGSQIDLLIVRKDQVINLCEMKYSDSEYTITKAVDEDIRRKINDLTIETRTKSAIHPTLVTSYGVTDNTYTWNIQAVINMDDLFAF